jgi:SNF2 family DNA or RNA helicase
LKAQKLTVVSGMKSLHENLKPAAYQLIPLAKLLSSGLGGILVADGVGVGKTVSAGYVLVYARARHGMPAFVVCSPTLIPKWLFELKSKFDANTIPVRSMEDLETATDETAHRAKSANQPVYIMSSSLLSKAKGDNYPSLSAAVFDEIHTFRNPNTRWYDGCMALAKRAILRIGLTATPINNSLEDLVTELSILLPTFSRDSVAAAVNDLWNSKRETLTGAVATRFVKERLGIHFARRILTSVPVIYPESYVREVRRAITEKSNGGTLLEQITYYRLAASSPVAFWKAIGVKHPQEGFDPKVEALRQVLSNSKISHWLLFCEFIDTVGFLSRSISDWAIFSMTGDTPIFERQSLMESFKRSPKALMILTSVGSEGLDLQFCSGLINYDLHWNPMKLEQRAGRIDRVGQQKNTVRIVNIHVINSIDNRVITVLRRKLQIVSDSVFAPGKILTESTVAKKAMGLYSDDAVAHEVDAGSSLVEMFGMNQGIQTLDYDILAKVDTSLCTPLVLASNASQVSGASIVKSEKWNVHVTDNSKSVSDLLNYYS